MIEHGKGAGRTQHAPAHWSGGKHLGIGRRLVVGTLAAGAVIAGSLSAAGTAAAAGGPRGAAGIVLPRATSGLETMIVLLRGPGGSVRSREVNAPKVQAPVVAELRSAGARIVATTSVIDAVIADMSQAQARALGRNPAVSLVVPSTSIPVSAPAGGSAAHGDGFSSKTHGTVGPAPKVACGTPSQPQLNPEALQNINAASVPARGIDGAGVTVGFMAGGFDPANADFQRNAAYASPGSPAGSKVVTIYKDFSGDGTAVPNGEGAVESFGDASSIAAQGNRIFDLSKFVNAAHPLPKGCDIKIVGDAPGASLAVLKIFGNTFATSSGFIQAINYAVTHGVKVINESFGGNPFPDLSNDLTRLANDAAVAAGVTVVASSGDAGDTNTQGSPSTDPSIISAGASTTFRTYAQEAFGGINWPGWNGSYIDNNLSAVSSSGYNQAGGTLDLVAPGDLNWADCSANPRIIQPGLCQSWAGKPSAMQDFGGTSESSPLIAGAAADVIQAYATTHHGTDPSPALVKQILLSTATDIGAPAVQQGTGLLNVGAAVKLAQSLPGSTGTPDGGLLVSPGQINIAGTPGTSSTHPVTLANEGARPVHVSLSTRTLASTPASTATGHFCLNPSSKAAPGCPVTQHSFPIWSGVTEVYKAVPFTVRGGVARLEFAADYPFTGQSSLLHFALFTPRGAYAAYSLAQGLGDYGEVEVANPPPGRWTAVFFTAKDDPAASPPVIGTKGTIGWAATTWKYVAGSQITPRSLSIPPGSTASATLAVTTPAQAGDGDESVVITSRAGQTTIPVTIRTLVGITNHGGRFSGVLTGGNGRGGAPGQENTYTFTVAGHEPSLDVGIHMASNPGNHIVLGDELLAYLVDPNGQAVGYSTNYTLVSGKPAAVTDVSLYHAHPIAGTWRVILQWANPVSGAALQVPFTGKITFTAFALKSNNLPDSAGTTLAQGQAASFTVGVCNPSAAPQDFFADPRTPGHAEYPLTNVFGANASQAGGAVTLPDADLGYILPPDTTKIRASILATLPVTFDLSYLPGDPDVSPAVQAPGVHGSQHGKKAALTFTSPEVSPGVWGLVPDEIGPYPPSGYRSGQAQVDLSVVTRPFDPTVTASTGDFWPLFTEVTSSMFSPLALTAAGTGASSCGTITVMITPTAPAGSVVTGTLYLDDYVIGSNINPSTTFIPQQILPMGDQLLAIPYEYTVSG